MFTVIEWADVGYYCWMLLYSAFDQMPNCLRIVPCRDVLAKTLILVLPDMLLLVNVSVLEKQTCRSNGYKLFFFFFL